MDTLAVMERLVDMMVIQGESGSLVDCQYPLRLFGFNFLPDEEAKAKAAKIKPVQDEVFNLFTEMFNESKNRGWVIQRKKVSDFVITLDSDKNTKVSIGDNGHGLDVILFDGPLVFLYASGIYLWQLIVNDFLPLEKEKKKDYLAGAINFQR